MAEGEVALAVRLAASIRALVDSEAAKDAWASPCLTAVLACLPDLLASLDSGRLIVSGLERLLASPTLRFQHIAALVPLCHAIAAAPLVADVPAPAKQVETALGSLNRAMVRFLISALEMAPETTDAAWAAEALHTLEMLCSPASTLTAAEMKRLAASASSAYRSADWQDVAVPAPDASSAASGTERSLLVERLLRLSPEASPPPEADEAWTYSLLRRNAQHFASLRGPARLLAALTRALPPVTPTPLDKVAPRVSLAGSLLSTLLAVAHYEADAKLAPSVLNLVGALLQLSADEQLAAANNSSASVPSLVERARIEEAFDLLTALHLSPIVLADVRVAVAASILKSIAALPNLVASARSRSCLPVNLDLAVLALRMMRSEVTELVDGRRAHAAALPFAVRGADASLASAVDAGVLAFPELARASSDPSTLASLLSAQVLDVLFSLLHASFLSATRTPSAPAAAVSTPVVPAPTTPQQPLTPAPTPASGTSAPAPPAPPIANKDKDLSKEPMLRASANNAEASFFGDLFGGEEKPTTAAPATPAPALTPAAAPAAVAGATVAQSSSDHSESGERDENEVLELCKDILHLLVSLLVPDRHAALAAFSKHLNTLHADVLLALHDPELPVHVDAEFGSLLRALGARFLAASPRPLERHLIDQLLPTGGHGALALAPHSAALVARMVLARHRLDVADADVQRILSLVCASLARAHATALDVSPAPPAPRPELLFMLQLLIATSPQPASLLGPVLEPLVSLLAAPTHSSVWLGVLLRVAEFVLHRAASADDADNVDMSGAEKALFAATPMPVSPKTFDALNLHPLVDADSSPTLCLYEIFKPSLRRAMVPAIATQLTAATYLSVHAALLTASSPQLPPNMRLARAAYLVAYVSSVAARLLVCLPAPSEFLARPLASPSESLSVPVVHLQEALLEGAAFSTVQPPSAPSVPSFAALLAWTEALLVPSLPLAASTHAAAFLSRASAAARQGRLECTPSSPTLVTRVTALLTAHTASSVLANATSEISSQVAVQALRAGLTESSAVSVLDANANKLLKRALTVAQTGASTAEQGRTWLQRSSHRALILSAPDALHAKAPVPLASLAASHAAIATLLSLLTALPATEGKASADLVPALAPFFFDTSLVYLRKAAERVGAAHGIAMNDALVAPYRVAALTSLLDTLTASAVAAPLPDSLLCDALAALATALRTAKSVPPALLLVRLSTLSLSVRAQEAVLKLLTDAASSDTRAALDAVLVSAPEGVLESWLAARVLGAGAEQALPPLVRLVQLLASPPNAHPPLARRLFLALLALLPKALSAFGPNVRPYFAFVQHLAAAQAQWLAELLAGLGDFLNAEANANADAAMPASTADALHLVFTFLHELLRAGGEAIEALPHSSADPWEEPSDAQLVGLCCTFKSTGATYVEQVWYHCYTCNLAFSEGVCAMCARTCHRGHELSYGRRSRFFCDCPAKTACKSQVPRAAPAAPLIPPAAANAKDAPASATVPQPMRDTVVAAVRAQESALLTLFERLFKRFRAEALSAEQQGPRDLLARIDKTFAFRTDLLDQKRSTKPSAIADVKLRHDGVRPEWRTLPRTALAANTRGQLVCGLVDRVEIIDAGRLGEEKAAPVGGLLDKAAVRVIGKLTLPFEVHALAFNALQPSYLLVRGHKQVHMLTISPRGDFTGHLVVDLSLDALGADLAVLQAHWLPGSATRVLVATNKWVKVYDLAADAMCPQHYLVPPPLAQGEEPPAIRDIALVQEANSGAAVHLLCLTVAADLFAEPLAERASNEGRRSMSLPVTLPSVVKAAKPTSLFVHNDSLLIASDDAVFLTRYVPVSGSLATPLGIAGTAVTKGDAKTRPAACSQWAPLPANDGSLLLLGLNRKANALTAIRVDDKDVISQIIKLPNAARIEGFAPVPLSRSAAAVHVMLEDGSLHRLDKSAPKEEVVVAAPAPSPAKAKAPRKNPDDEPRLSMFFERAENVTRAVQLGGPDLLALCSSALAKARLAASDKCLLSPSPESFSVSLQLPLPGLVIAGVRVLLGASSLEHLPRTLRLGTRTHNVLEANRRWYDLVLTRDEAAAAARAGELTLTLQGCYTANNTAALDSLEVYAVPVHRLTRPLPDARLATPLALLAALHAPGAAVSAPAPSNPLLVRLQNELLPAVLTDPACASLRPSLLRLLRRLCASRAAYVSLKDNAVLTHVATLLAPPASPTAASFSSALRLLLRLAVKRPLSLGRTNAANAVTHLTGAFNALYSTPPASEAAAVAAEMSAGSLAHVLYASAYALLNTPPTPPAALGSLAKLLLSKSAAVRQGVADALVRLLKATPRSALFPALEALQAPITGDAGPECVDPAAEAALLSALALSLTPDDAPAPSSPPPPESALRIAVLQAVVQVANLDALKALGGGAGGVALVPYFQVLHATVALAQPAIPDSEILPVLQTLYTPLASKLPNAPSLPTADLHLSALAVLFWTHVLRAENASPALLRALHNAGALNTIQATLTRLDEEFRKAAARSKHEGEASKSSGGAGASVSSGALNTGLLSASPLGSAGVSLAPFIPENTEDTEDDSVDPFAEPLRLLASSALHLLSALLRPDSTASVTSRPPEFDARWRRLVAGFLGKRQSEAVRHEAKAILLQVCGGDKNIYHRVRDEEALRKLYEKLEQCLEHRTPAQMVQDEDAVYADNVRLVRTLGRLASLATNRPQHWLYFAFANPPVLPTLFRAALSPLPDEGAQRLLALLGATFLSDSSNDNHKDVKDLSKDAIKDTLISSKMDTKASPLASPSAPAAVPGSPIIVSKMDLSDSQALLDSIPVPSPAVVVATPKTRVLMQSSHDEHVSTANTEGAFALASKLSAALFHGDDLPLFIDALLLQHAHDQVRSAARLLLYRLWHHCSAHQRDRLLSALVDKIGVLPSYGRQANEAAELLAFCVANTADVTSMPLVTRVADALASAMRTQHNLLATHPNGLSYRTLAKVLELEGYYLESDPCPRCSETQVAYVQVKAESIRTEGKFTANAVLYRFLCPYQIAHVTLRLSDLKRGRLPRLIHVYANNRASAELAQLRTNKAEWRRVKSHVLPVTQGPGEVRIELELPVTARHLMIEYAAFHEPPGGAAERLMCPRCNRPVTDRHGFCGNCHESAFQCRQCRNINYESAAGGFLCNECGFSRYGNFQYMLLCRPALAADRIETDEDSKRASKQVEKHAETAAKKREQIAELRRPIARLAATIGHSHDLPEATRRACLRDAGAGAASAARQNRKIFCLSTLYGRECHDASEALSKAHLLLGAAKREVLRYEFAKALAARDRVSAPAYASSGGGRSALRSSSSSGLHDTANASSAALAPLPPPPDALSPFRAGVPPPPNRCFGCALHFVSQAASLLDLLAESDSGRKAALRVGVPEELLTSSLPLIPALGSRLHTDLRMLIAQLVRSDVTASTSLLHRLSFALDAAFASRLEPSAALGEGIPLADTMALLLRMCEPSQTVWPDALSVLLKSFLRVSGNEKLRTDPYLGEHFLVPALAALLAIARPRVQADDVIIPVVGAEPVSSLVADESLTSQLIDWSAMASGVPPHASPAHFLASPSASFAAWSAKYGRAVARQRSTAVPVTPSIAKSKIPVTVALVAKDEKAKVSDPMQVDVKDAKDKVSSPAVPEAKSDEAVARAAYLSEKYGKRWMSGTRMAIASNATPPVLPAIDAWAVPLLLHPTSPAVRHATSSLLAALTDHDNARALSLLLLLSHAMPAAVDAGEAASDYFQLWQRLTREPERRVFVALKGALAVLARAVATQVVRLSELDANGRGGGDASMGLALKWAADALAQLCAVPEARARLRSLRLSDDLLRAFLALRALVAAKSHATDETARLLLQLLNPPAPASAPTTNTPDNRAFLSACVQALGSEPNSGVFILEQMCNVVAPPKPEPAYQLVLNKSATQEDFLRGSMTKNPYTATDMGGSLMRDVKNKVCRELDLAGLIEDDSGMELLVAGQIIKLDLPIRGVYEKIWLRSLPNPPPPNGPSPPMVVIYRLKGLDGEATEEIVESLPSANDEADADPEARYAVTSLLAESGAAGLKAVLAPLRALNNLHVPRQSELASHALRLLSLAAKLKVNRTGLVQMMAVPDLLGVLRLAFRADERQLPSLNALLAQLLLLIECTVQEAALQATPATTQTAVADLDLGDALAQMRAFLTRLDTPVVRTNAAMRLQMTRVLPYLTYGRGPVAAALVEHFKPHVAAYLATPNDDSPAAYWIDCLATAAANIPSDTTGTLLKARFLTEGVPATITAHLLRAAPPDAPTAEWETALRAAGVTQALTLLAAFARAHAPTAAQVGEGALLPQLLRMEATSAVERVPQLAEALVDTLAAEGVAKDKIEAARKEAKAARQAQADLRRQKVLAELGLSKQTGNKVVAAAMPSFMLELEESSGLRCLACQEGYSFKPTELFGFYTFTKRVALALQGRAEYGYSTVTHFNVIHGSCHRDAAKADKALKQPKEEWDGATIRNSQTKCNNLFPVQAAQVTDDAYAQGVDRYWQNMQRVGRADAHRFRLLTHDLKTLLLRYAREESFSADAKGGGRESNVRMVPFVLQMGIHLLDGKNAQVKRPVYEKQIATLLSASDVVAVTSEASAQADSPWYWACASLWLLSLEEWHSHRAFFMRSLLINALIDDRILSRSPPAAAVLVAGAPPAAAPAPLEASDPVFRVARPALLFFAFIDRLHKAFKPLMPKPVQGSAPVAIPAAAAAPASHAPPGAAAAVGPVLSVNIAHKADEAWITAMQAHFRMSDTKPIDLATEILKDFEEALMPAESVQELLDELGLLQTALAEAPSADDFVKQIWAKCPNKDATK